VKICDHGLGFEFTYVGLSKCTQFCKADSSLLFSRNLAALFGALKFSGTLIGESDLCVDRSCFGVAN
jgi:hypothetical protein